MKNSRFALAWILAIASIYGSLPVEAGNAVPVWIWDGETNGSPSSPVNPLQKTSQSEFEKILMKKVGGAPRPVLVFVRDSLCTEDFTQHREGLRHLKDGDTYVYVPAVDSPMTVFENLPYYNQSKEEELVSVSDGQLIITEVGDLDAVSETFNMVKDSSPNLIAALTGRSCDYNKPERVRRAADDAKPTPAPKADDDAFIVKLGRILMYASAPPTLEVSPAKDVETTFVNYSNDTKASPPRLIFEYNVKNTSFSEKVTVTMEFANSTTGYRYIKVVYGSKDGEVPLPTKVDTTFARNFSYHCSNITFTDRTVKFSIMDFQAQLDTDRFDDAYDCVGFTTIPIWAGIFVTGILALIMIWGLTMIMDIRTMDRFDDPKGKTITISASE